MPISARLDEETEDLLFKTAAALNATRTEILKRSIRDFCRRTLEKKTKKPYDLIEDLIGEEYSGKGNLAEDSEEILRKAFSKKS
ncbi:MAG: hypothetical protein HN366_22685 [Deltaproteobacteria bacterium]|jgi:hypothetical protein|nr:hypothetical protein [Deltaproteobacteria bacterium]